LCVFEEHRSDSGSCRFRALYHTKFLYPLEESMFKKSAKSEMVTGRLVDSYKKTALKKILLAQNIEILSSKDTSQTNCDRER
jgi:hypothetical protein